jgi:AcrR family transcriptional regulator
MATPIPTEERPQRADARRNRERILDAALAEFAEHASGAQMEDVARRANVGVGTVYRHFPTKEALLVAVMARRFTRFAGYAEEALAVDDPWEAFATLVCRSAEDMAAEAGAQEALALVDKAAGHPEIEEALEPLVARSAQLIAQAHEAGVLRPDFTNDDLPAFMCGICESVAAAVRQERDWRRYVQFALDGLRARG